MTSVRRNSMTSVSTFPITMHNRKESYNTSDKRVALAARELIRNAIPQKAKNVLIANLYKEGCYYLAVAHDGMGFDSYSHLENCMKPSVSGGEGVQGNGMKASMFLLVPCPDMAQLVVHSYSNPDIACKLTNVNYNDAQVQDVSSDWGPYLKSVMGKLYGQYQVIYLVRYVNQKIKKELTADGQAHGQGIVGEEAAQLISELCNCSGLSVKFYETVFGEGLKYASFDAQGAVHSYPLLSSDSFDAKFMAVEEQFDVKHLAVDVNGDEKVFAKFDAQVAIKVYPNICRDGRLINIKEEGKIGENCHLQHSKEGLYVTCEFQFDCKKDVKRASEDPYFSSIHSYDLLTDIGIYAHRQADFTDKLEKYWPDLVGIPNLTWKPLIKIFIKIKPVGNEVYAFGDLNEFFHADNHSQVRKIAKIIFDKLGSQNLKKLENFRQKVKECFPFDACELAPLPSGELVNKNDLINVIVDVNGKPTILRNLKPGEYRNLVRLEYNGLDGKPVVETLTNITDGVSLEKVGENMYNLHVSPLIKIENGKKSPITAEQYSHESHPNGDKCIPKKHNYCDVGSARYQFTFYVDTPFRTANSVKRPQKGKSDKIGDNMSDENYAIFGPGLYGVYDKGILKLNKENAVIREMASFNPSEHPALWKKWLEIYTEASRMARIGDSDLANIDIRGFIKKIEPDFVKSFDSPERWFVNNYLKVFFESKEAADFREKIKAQ